MSQVSGHISTIKFQDPDEGFYIAEMVLSDKKRLSIKGNSIHDLRVGDYIHTEGTIKNHSKYGPSLEANYIRVDLTGESGVQNWLINNIEGVGIKTASKLIDKASKSKIALPDFLQDVSLLKKVVSSSVANSIVEKWTEDKARSEKEAMLLNLGLQPSLVNKVIDKYPANEIYAVLTNNPWRLAKDIEGLGFKAADQLALAQGLARDDQRRVKGGINYYLEDYIKNEGHLCSRKIDILRSVPNLLGLPVSLIEANLNDMVANNELSILTNASGDSVFMSVRDFNMNTKLASRIIEKSMPDESINLSKIKLLMNDAAKKIGKDFKGEFKFHSLQEQAAINVFQNKLSVITGGPGTGKTLTVRLIINIAQKLKLNIKAGSFTASAAERISEVSGLEASTIHSLLGAKGQSGGFEHNSKNPLDTDLLIIDESSLNDQDISQKLINAIADDTRVVFVGDADQLPSVGAGEFLRDLINSTVVPTTRLEVTHRQSKDSGIITAAEHINKGKPPPASEDFVVFMNNNPNTLLAATPPLLKQILPKRGYTWRDVYIMAPMRKGVVGTVALNKKMKETFNPLRAGQPYFELKDGNSISVGDPVMMTKNQRDTKGVINGNVGEVIDFELGPNGKIENIEVEFDLGRRHRVSYTPKEARSMLDMSYVSTNHKAQGREAKVSLVFNHSEAQYMLNRRLFYTGVTRGKELVICFCDKRGLETSLSRSGASRVTAFAYMLKNEKNKLLAKTKEEQDASPAKAHQHLSSVM